MTGLKTHFVRFIQKCIEKCCQTGILIVFFLFSAWSSLHAQADNIRKSLNKTVSVEWIQSKFSTTDNFTRDARLLVLNTSWQVKKNLWLTTEASLAYQQISNIKGPFDPRNPFRTAMTTHSGYAAGNPMLQISYGGFPGIRYSLKTWIPVTPSNTAAYIAGFSDLQRFESFVPGVFPSSLSFTYRRIPPSNLSFELQSELISWIPTNNTITGDNMEAFLRYGVRLKYIQNKFSIGAGFMSYVSLSGAILVYTMDSMRQFELRADFNLGRIRPGVYYRNTSENPIIDRTESDRLQSMVGLVIAYSSR